MLDAGKYFHMLRTVRIEYDPETLGLETTEEREDISVPTQNDVDELIDEAKPNGHSSHADDDDETNKVEADIDFQFSWKVVVNRDLEDGVMAADNEK